MALAFPVTSGAGRSASLDRPVAEVAHGRDEIVGRADVQVGAIGEDDGLYIKTVVDRSLDDIADKQLAPIVAPTCF